MYKDLDQMDKTLAQVLNILIDNYGTDRVCNILDGMVLGEIDVPDFKEDIKLTQEEISAKSAYEADDS